MYRFLIVFGGFLFTACQAIYAPTTNIPTVFKDKDDVRVSTTFSPSIVAANVAYTPIKHFYIHAASVYNFGIDQPSFNTYSFAGGAGFYHQFNEQHHVEAQYSFVRGTFDYHEWGVYNSLDFREATGNYQAHSGFLCYTQTRANGSHSLIISAAFAQVHYNNSIERFYPQAMESQPYIAFNYLWKKPIGNHFNFILSPGINLTFTTRYPGSLPFYFRTGFEFKLKN